MEKKINERVAVRGGTRENKNTAAAATRKKTPVRDIYVELQRREHVRETEMRTGRDVIVILALSLVHIRAPSSK